MPTPVTDEELNRLLDFIGYGSLNAEVWFLGMEEAGSGEDHLRTRLTFDAVEDCAEAHQRLGIDKHHWGRRVIQPTWRSMCYIMLALDGRSPTREQIREYQANHLGRRHGTTLLTERMPIPRRSIRDWDDLGLFPQFKDVHDRIFQVKRRRIEYLRRLFYDYKPKLVIGYGRGYWPDFQQVFEASQFRPEGRFLVGGNEHTRIILTDHFISRSMNGKLDSVVEIGQRTKS